MVEKRSKKTKRRQQVKCPICKEYYVFMTEHIPETVECRKCHCHFFTNKKGK